MNDMPSLRLVESMSNYLMANTIFLEATFWSRCHTEGAKTKLHKVPELRSSSPM